MSSKKRAAGMDALADFHEEDTVAVVEPVEQGRAVKAEPVIAPAHTTKVNKGPGRPRRDYPEGVKIITTSTYIPEPAHDKLREYVFLHKGTSINDCLLEGLDLFFKKKGIHPIHQLVQDEAK